MKKDSISYAPWSSSNLQKAINGYNKGKMPILYLELSAKCTKCDCLYCDSPVHDDIQDELSFDANKTIIVNNKNPCGIHKHNQERNRIHPANRSQCQKGWRFPERGTQQQPGKPRESMCPDPLQSCPGCRNGKGRPRTTNAGEKKNKATKDNPIERQIE